MQPTIRPDSPAADGQALVANLVAFVRLLRRAGMVVSPAQVATLARALEHVSIDDRQQFRGASRAILVSGRDQLAVFDRLFELFWRRNAARPGREIELGRSLRRIAEQQRRQLARLADEPSPISDLPEIEADVTEPVVEHSDLEALRQTDFARLTDAELERVRRLLLERPLTLPPRRTRRRRPSRGRGTVDLRRTADRARRHGGEPLELLRQRPKLRPRPLVVLCDISGSMEIYSRIFLQFVYGLRAATPALEVFVFGTRLTRITRELRSRDIDRALGDAAAKIVDWGGGTRIGEAFREFHRHWARRVLGGGAVVLVVSDAWDRGETELLARETGRLARSCSRLLWLDPLLGSEGFEPVASGIRAVLPHVDDYLPVHDLRSLDQLAEVLRQLGNGRSAERAPGAGEPLA